MGKSSPRNPLWPDWFDGEKIAYGEKSAVRGVRCTQKIKHNDESKDCKTLPYGVQYVQTVRHYFAKNHFMLLGGQGLRYP